MTDWPILSTVTFLPLVGVALLLFTREDGVFGRRNILNVSLLTTVFTFIVSLFIWAGFDNANAGFQMVEKHGWLGTGIAYHLAKAGWLRWYDELPSTIIRPGKTPIGVLKMWLVGVMPRGLAQLPSILRYAVFSCAPAIEILKSSSGPWARGAMASPRRSAAISSSVITR